MSIKGIATRTIKNHKALEVATGTGLEVCTAQIVADARLLAEATLRHCAASKLLMRTSAESGFKLRWANLAVEYSELQDSIAKHTSICPNTLDHLTPEEVFAQFNMGAAERAAFQAAYDVGIQHVSEILRCKGYVE